MTNVRLYLLEENKGKTKVVATDENNITLEDPRYRLHVFSGDNSYGVYRKAQYREGQKVIVMPNPSLDLTMFVPQRGRISQIKEITRGEYDSVIQRQKQYGAEARIGYDLRQQEIERLQKQIDALKSQNSGFCSLSDILKSEFLQ